MKIYNKSLKLKVIHSQIIVILLLFTMTSIGQEMPPRPTTIRLITGLNFGAFTYGPGGGTITVHPNGSRTYMGSIYPLSVGSIYHPALFEVDAHNTLVSLYFSSDITLSGSNGGTILLNIEQTDPPSPFMNSMPLSSPRQVRVGGSLTIVPFGTYPSGIYSGSFSVTLIKE